MPEVLVKPEKSIVFGVQAVLAGTVRVPAGSVTKPAPLLYDTVIVVGPLATLAFFN